MHPGGSLIVAVASIVALAACSSSSSPTADSADASEAGSYTPRPVFSPTLPEAWNIEGSLVIINSGLGDSAQARLTRVKTDPDSLDCEGANAYSFAREGESVTLRNAQGTTVSLGRLSAGMDRTPPKDARLECTFTFTLADVPESPFYSVQIGSEEPIQYTKAELRSGLDLVLD